MKNLLKRYGAILLFAVFLFPQAEIALHTWQHVNDFHCKSTTTHVHLPQHDCSICDFISPSIIDAVVSDFLLAPLTHTDFKAPFREIQLFSAPLLFISLRAPPVIS